MKYTALLFFVFITLISSAVQAEISSAPPTAINVDRHYLFYLHGQIVEGSDGWPSSEFFGTYEYPNIVKALEDEGFWVISENLCKKRLFNDQALQQLLHR